MRENKNSASLIISFALYLGTFMVAESQPQWKGTTTKDGNVVVVKNPKEPLYKGDVFSLKEELAIGGANAKESYVLTEVESLAVDEAGTIYTLDRKDLCIKVYDRLGTFLRTIGRKGEGPGEFTRPYGVTIDKKNRYLVVQDVRIGLVVFNYEGKFIKNVQNDDLKPVQKVLFDSHGNLVLNRIKIQDMEHRWDELKKYSPNLALIAEIKSIPIGSPYNIVAPMVTWDLDAEDNIVYGYPSRYEIEIIDDQNKTIRKIQKESDPVELTAEEKERIAQSIKSLALPADLAAKIFASKYHSAFIAIHIGGDGHIFVTTWKKSGKNNINDIFDKDGRFLAEIAFPSRRVFFAIGHLYTIEEDTDGYPIIKRYAMSWTQGR